MVRIDSVLHKPTRLLGVSKQVSNDDINGRIDHNSHL